MVRRCRASGSFRGSSLGGSKLGQIGSWGLSWSKVKGLGLWQ